MIKEEVQKAWSNHIKNARYKERKSLFCELENGSRLVKPIRMLNMKQPFHLKSITENTHIACLQGKYGVNHLPFAYATFTINLNA